MFLDNECGVVDQQIAMREMEELSCGFATGLEIGSWRSSLFFIFSYSLYYIFIFIENNC